MVGMTEVVEGCICEVGIGEDASSDFGSSEVTGRFSFILGGGQALKAVEDVVRGMKVGDVRAVQMERDKLHSEAVPCYIKLWNVRENELATASIPELRVLGNELAKEGKFHDALNVYRRVIRRLEEEPDKNMEVAMRYVQLEKRRKGGYGGETRKRRG